MSSLSFFMKPYKIFSTNGYSLSLMEASAFFAFSLSEKYIDGFPLSIYYFICDRLKPIPST